MTVALLTGGCPSVPPYSPPLAAAIAADGTVSVLIPPLCHGDVVVSAEFNEATKAGLVVLWRATGPAEPRSNLLVLDPSEWESVEGDYKATSGDLGISVNTTRDRIGTVIDRDAQRRGSPDVFVENGIRVSREEYERRVRGKWPCE